MISFLWLHSDHIKQTIHYLSAEGEHPVQHYPLSDVHSACQHELESHGVPANYAAAMADALVFGEATGSTTHGLSLLTPYLEAIASGGMALEGHYEVLSDFHACQVWDGRKLPGAWLMKQAIACGMQRAAAYGVSVVAVKNSHHTGCLAAYLEMATSKGYVASIALTDPAHSSVAPWGGTTPVMTSNPVAFGAPGEATPIWIDMATSSVTNGAVQHRLNAGENFSSEVLLDGYGKATDNPAVINDRPPGSILPLGGKSHGHKGYALSVMVEILAGCLSGGGRAEPPSGWGASFTVTLYAPGLICGEKVWNTQLNALIRQCHGAAPAHPYSSVRLPGERSWHSLQHARQHGLWLNPAQFIWLNNAPDPHNNTSQKHNP